MNKYLFTNNCGLEVYIKELVCGVIIRNSSSLYGGEYLVVLGGLRFESCGCH